MISEDTYKNINAIKVLTAAPIIPNIGMKIKLSIIFKTADTIVMIAMYVVLDVRYIPNDEIKLIPKNT